jgi:ACS family hexuronate transporter-like MFS transporter
MPWPTTSHCARRSMGSPCTRRRGRALFTRRVGEAGNWPAAVKLTAEWFPPRERSTASGILNGGSALGSVITPPLVAWLGVRCGWRAAFLAVGILGYLWLIAFWFVCRSPAPTGREGAASGARATPRDASLRRLVRRIEALHRSHLVLHHLLDRPLPRRRPRLELGRIGLYAMCPFLVADLGNVLGGSCSSPWGRSRGTRGWSRRRRRPAEGPPSPAPLSAGPRDRGPLAAFA